MPSLPRPATGRFLLLALAVALALAGAAACGSAVGDTAAPDATVKSDGPSPTMAPADTDAVLVIGDSLTNGARRFGGLARRLGNAGFDRVDIVAEVGRDVTWAIGEVEDRLTVPELVVVELGTNPSAEPDGFAAAVGELLDALRARGAVRIAWLTPAHGRDDRYDDKTAILESSAGIDLVADWAALVRDDPRRLAADGLHPTEDGYADLARFLADTASDLAGER